jgi:biopolymer transport protein ExbD
MHSRPHDHQDPHAHFVVAPGKRLWRHLPLASVWAKVRGGGGRSVNANLNLTSYIDFLLVTVIFLLMTFSASGDFGVDKHIQLPDAENVEALQEAPVVAVNGNQVLVDGQLAGSTRAIEDVGRLQKVDELFELLRRKRELWESFHPNQRFPGVAILQIDQEVPSLVVKSVFQTAAFAGYPQVSFMVRKRVRAGG